MKNIPEKIYLQHGLTDEELMDVDYKEIHEWMTFSAYQMNKDDLEYVHISQLEKEREEIIKVLEDIKEYQMRSVQLARTTEVYKIAENTLDKLRTQNQSNDE